MTPANRQQCMVANPAAHMRWQIRTVKNRLSSLHVRRLDFLLLFDP